MYAVILVATWLNERAGDNSAPPRPDPNVLSAPAATVESGSAKKAKAVDLDETKETNVEGLGTITSSEVDRRDEPSTVPQGTAQEASPNETSNDSKNVLSKSLEEEEAAQNDKSSGSAPGAHSESKLIPREEASIESVAKDCENPALQNRQEIDDNTDLIQQVLGANAVTQSSEVVTSASDDKIASCDADERSTGSEDKVNADSPDSIGTTSQGNADGNEEEDTRVTCSNEVVPDEMGVGATSLEVDTASDCPNLSAGANEVRDGSSTVVAEQSSDPTSDACVERDTAPIGQMIVGERNKPGSPSSVDNAVVISTEVPVIEPPAAETGGRQTENAEPISEAEHEEQIVKDVESWRHADCEGSPAGSAESTPTTTAAADIVEASAEQPEDVSQVDEKEVGRGVEEEIQRPEAVADELEPATDGLASTTLHETIVVEETPTLLKEGTGSHAVDVSLTTSDDLSQTIVIEETIETPSQHAESAPVAGAIHDIATASEDAAQAMITEEKPTGPEGTMSVSDSINRILTDSDDGKPITELRNVTSMTRVLIPDEKRNSKPSVADRWGLSTTMSKVKTKALIALQGTDEPAVSAAPHSKPSSGSDKATGNDKPTTTKAGWSSPKSVERVLISLSEELAPPSPPSASSPKSSSQKAKTGGKVSRSSSGRSSEGKPASSRASPSAPAPVSKELTEIEKARLFAASVLAETEKRAPAGGDIAAAENAGQQRSWWKQKVVASLQHEL